MVTKFDATTTPFQPTVPAQSQQPIESIQGATGVERSVSTDQDTDRISVQRRAEAIC